VPVRLRVRDVAGAADDFLDPEHGAEARGLGFPLVQPGLRLELKRSSGDESVSFTVERNPPLDDEIRPVRGKARQRRRCAHRGPHLCRRVVLAPQALKVKAAAARLPAGSMTTVGLGRAAMSRRSASGRRDRGTTPLPVHRRRLGIGQQSDRLMSGDRWRNAHVSWRADSRYSARVRPASGHAIQQRSAEPLDGHRIAQIGCLISIPLGLRRSVAPNAARSWLNLRAAVPTHSIGPDAGGSVTSYFHAVAASRHARAPRIATVVAHCARAVSFSQFAGVHGS